MHRETLILCCLASAAFGQPAFDVASVKSAAANPAEKGRDIVTTTVEPASLTYLNVTLQNCLAVAYGVKPYQIAGPSWLSSERFDIVAKTAESVPKSEIMRMFQALLADRFKIAMHREQRELPVYALTVARNGLKIEKAQGEENPRSNVDFQQGGLVMSNDRISMDSLVRFLASMMPDRPVTNGTGLDGLYKVRLRFLPETPGLQAKMAAVRQVRQEPEDAAAAPSLPLALQEQLGLRLEPKKSATEVLVIDRAEKIPVEN
jgi:uncharacterized protein (TIGR03435 family)